MLNRLRQWSTRRTWRLTESEFWNAEAYITVDVRVAPFRRGLNFMTLEVNPTDPLSEDPWNMLSFEGKKNI
jgi:hypothetical protein